MSKLSQLKQDAYQAGKKRDWDQAVSIYEQILELDKTNPTLINELGDLCLKSGKTQAGVKHFLSAASKYRHSGLLNNAVAIYKKILRYDNENMNAHWYLADSRASQGLLMEGAQHALLFLSNQENLSTDIKEIFLKRCVQLTELYPDNVEILESLLQVFRVWNMAQEAGRIQIQLACQKWEEGEQDIAKQMVAETLEQMPELSNYPEHSLWLEKTGTSAQPTPANDFDSVDFEQPKAATPAPIVEIPSEPAETLKPAEPIEQNIDTPVSADPETSFGDLNDTPASEPVVEPVVNQDPFSIPSEKTETPESDLDVPDDGGCFNLDMDDEGSNFDDLIAQASAGVSDTSNKSEETPEKTLDEDNQEALPDNLNSSGEESASINLLDELLAEDTAFANQETEKEEETIIEEIGAQLGGDSSATDPASLYEMGMVYLDMDMFDQACDSFQKASTHDDFAVRAFEMWGITLLRENKVDEAIAILTDGLDVPEEGSREYLGLLYHIARAHEQGKNTDEAVRLFDMIHHQDPGFIDVGRRLAKLATLS